jgi:hypothetical protein
MPDGTIVPARSATMGNMGNGTLPAGSNGAAAHGIPVDAYGDPVPVPVSNGQPLHGVPVDAYGDPVGIIGSSGQPPHGVPVDAYGDPAMSVIPPDTAPLVPGTRYSDNEAISQGPLPHVPVAQHEHGNIVLPPGSIPMDTANTPHAHSQHPATSADPPHRGKVKPAKQVWDTNPAKHPPLPVTTTHNVAPSVAPDPPHPATEHEIPVINEPASGTLQSAKADDALAVVPLGAEGAMGDGAPNEQVPTSVKGGKGVKWSPRVPSKPVDQPAVKNR